MMLPVGDAPNPRGVAAVTWLLIAANVAVFVLVTMPLAGVPADPRDPLLPAYVQVVRDAMHGRLGTERILAEASAYDLFVFRWGFRPVDASVVTLFASMFLHGGFMHLAGNMLFLWIYGDNVEHRLGPVAFLLAYLGTGVAATLFHAAGAPESAVPMVGASGAISGVLGLYFVWFPRNVVRLLWLLPPFLMRVMEVPARIVLGIYLLLDNLLPYLATDAGDAGVAHGAHIGGFVAGLAGAWLLDRRALAARPTAYAAGAPTPPREAPSAGRSLGEAIDAGRLDEAAHAYFRIPVGASRGVLTPAHSLALADWLAEAGHGDAALVVVRRHLRDFPRGPGLAEAHALAGELLLAAGQPTPAFQHFQAALDVAPPPSVEARVRRGLAAVAALQKRQVGRAPDAR